MKFLKKIRRLHRPGTQLAAAVLPLAQHKASGDDRLPVPKFTSTIGLLFVLRHLTGLGRGAVTTPAGVDTNPLNLDPLVRQSFQRFYILDYDGALSGFEKVQAQNPTNPLAVDYVLDTVIFRELYRLDLLDTTFYAHDGFLNGKHAVAADPAVAEQVNSLFTKAIDLSGQQLSKNPEDVDALFARAWARSLHAVYIGLVRTELCFRPPCRFAGSQRRREGAAAGPQVY